MFNRIYIHPLKNRRIGAAHTTRRILLESQYSSANIVPTRIGDNKNTIEDANKAPNDGELTFIDVDDTNLLLSIVETDDFEFTFTMGWAGILSAVRGGTGIDDPGAIDNVLTSDGLGNWVSAAPGGGYWVKIGNVLKPATANDIVEVDSNDSDPCILAINSHATAGIGVYGLAQSANGLGVQGAATGSNGVAVSAQAANNSVGLLAFAEDNNAVAAENTSAIVATILGVNGGTNGPDFMADGQGIFSLKERVTINAGRSGFVDLIATDDHRIFGVVDGGAAQDLNCLHKQTWQMTNGAEADVEKFDVFFNKIATGTGYTSTTTKNTVDYTTGYVTDCYTRVRTLFKTTPVPVFTVTDACSYMFNASFRKFQNEISNDGVCAVVAKVRLRWGNSITPTAGTVTKVEFFICEEGGSTNRATTGNVKGSLTTAWQEFTIPLTDVSSWNDDLRWGIMFVNPTGTSILPGVNQAQYLDIERVSIEQWVA